MHLIPLGQLNALWCVDEYVVGVATGVGAESLFHRSDRSVAKTEANDRFGRLDRYDFPCQSGSVFVFFWWAHEFPGGGVAVSLDGGSH